MSIGSEQHLRTDVTVPHYENLVNLIVLFYRAHCSTYKIWSKKHVSPKLTKNDGFRHMNQTRQVWFTVTIFAVPHGQVFLLGTHYFKYLKLSDNKGLIFEPWHT